MHTVFCPVERFVAIGSADCHWIVALLCSRYRWDRVMGVDHRVDRGTSPPLFEVGGRNVYCPPHFLGQQIFIMCKFTIFLLLILLHHSPRHIVFG